MASLNRLTERASAIGALPSDPPEVRVRNAALLLLAGLIVPLSTVWVVTYGVLGLWAAASIPLAYQIVSILTFVLFARSGRFHVFRAAQLTMMLFLPFVLQWTLGGFRASSAVALWAIASPMGALVFLGPDTGHLAWAGADPVAFCRDYASQIKTIHVKDVDEKVRLRGRAQEWDYGTFAANGIFAELGEGNVDFPAIFAILRDAGFAGWVIAETDVTQKPTALESATISRAYLKSFGM